MSLTTEQEDFLKRYLNKIINSLSGGVTVSENLAQVNGATVNVGTGASGTGTQRVAVAYGAQDLGKAEDVAHVSGDVGVMGLGVANEAQGTFAADGDYVPHAVDRKGNVYVTGQDIDNAAQTNTKPVYTGGKAVDCTTYAPAYTAADSVGQAYDITNGGMLVNQANLQEDQDIVTTYSKCTSTSAGTPSAYRLQGSINTATAVKASAGNLYGWNIRNNTGASVYVKFYDTAQGSVVVGTTAVVLSLQIPANGTIYQDPTCVQHNFATAITVASVTGFLDSDATSPGANNVTLELKYK